MIEVEDVHLDDATRAQLSAFEERLGHRFADRELLVRALTHRSYLNEERCVEKDNQRMEFLGDAVIGLVITAVLFERYPGQSEGALSRLKAHLVCTTTLAELARELELGGCLMLGKGEASSGGRSKDKLLADAYEALVAAIYLDGGIEAARGFVLREHAEILASLAKPSAIKDAKSRLQEWLQERHGERPTYRIVEVTGPPHARCFVAEVVLEEEVLGRGSGRSKKGAQRSAAADALCCLESK